MKKKTILSLFALIPLLMGCVDSFNNGNNGINSGGQTTPPVGPIDTEIKIESISFKEESIALAINRTATIEYTVLPENATNQSLRWTSSDSETVSVSTRGTIKAFKEGDVTITATAMDGSNVSASINVMAYPINANEITLTPTRKAINVGDKFTITPYVLPSNATYQDVEFSSDDENIASVTQKGVVEGLGKGETDIICKVAKNPSLSAKCHVTVNEIYAEKLIAKRNAIEMHVGDNYFYSLTLVPSNTTNKGISYINNNPDIVSVDSSTGEIKGLAEGTATIAARSDSNPELTHTLSISVKGTNKKIKSSLSYTFKDYANNSFYNYDNADYLEINALVIPVWFTNSSNYLNEEEKVQVREDIRKAYFGTEQETGWNSVKTFYEKESFGRFTFNGVVSDWYECGYSSSYYESTNAGGNNTVTLVNSAVNWYKRHYDLSSMSGFDADYNGLIDSVILIYAGPDHQSAGTLENNFWAYTYWAGNKPDYNDPNPCTFFWASYDFMYGSNKNISHYFGGDTRYCELDTHTYIHEFGHCLGLSDYYDYSVTYRPAGGFSMQDENVGGHDPYSLMALGFVDPYVVTGSETITIQDFQSSGDCILVTNEYSSSPFDEYILLELYTPTGLNEFDTVHQYQDEDRNYSRGVNEPGIRIWHVDARLIYSNSYSGFKASNVTTNPLIDGYKVHLMMSNSYNVEYGSLLGSNYINYNELQLIRNDEDFTYRDARSFDSDSLFKQGDRFNLNKFSKQFVNGAYKLNSGKTFAFNITVDSLSDSEATITITK